MTKTLTPLQRIERLHDRDIVDGAQYQTLRDMERASREDVRRVFYDLNVTATEFFAVHFDFLKCRTQRHWWEDAEFTWDYKPYGVPEVQVCLRCGTRKITVYTVTGRRNGSPRYLPPEGYSLGDLGRRLGQEDHRIIRRHIKLLETLVLLESDPSLVGLATATK